MSKFFSLCKINQHSHHSRQENLKKTTRSRTPGNFYRYSVPVLTLAIIVFGMLYIFNITSFATDGFKITAEQEKYQSLKLANETLRAKVNNLSNLGVVKDKAAALGLQPTGSVQYVVVISSAGVAVNK